MTTSLFTFDWDTYTGSDQIVAPELAATMARLEISVHSRFLTIAEDLLNSSIRRSINVPLYPLAEWIVFNWWTLLYNGRLADGSFRTDSRRVNSHAAIRNNLRASGDGFIWPDVLIKPDGALIRLEWRAETTPRPGSRIKFITSGSEYVDPSWVEESFTDLVESVLHRLDEAGTGETPLSKEWAALRALDSEEVEFCEACGRLGLDPFSEGVDLASSIEDAFAALDSSLVWDFFDAASPEKIGADVEWVDKATSMASGSNAPPGRLDLARVFGDPAQDNALGRRPYQVGYSRARALRNALGVSPDAAFPVGDLPLNVSVLESAEPALEGLVRGSPEGDSAGLVLGWQRSEAAQRFATCRALWHLLSGEVGHPSLLTATASPGQQTARAFAAELLVPAEGIRRLLGGTTGAIAAAPLIADYFGVSEMVVEHQIENQLSTSGYRGSSRT